MSGYTMGTVATVRIDEKTRRKIKRYGISVSDVARELCWRRSSADSGQKCWRRLGE